MKISKITAKWIVLAILIAFVAAGGLIAWAAPPEDENDSQETAAKPTEVNPVGTVAPVPVPTRGPIPRIAVDAELIGTAVVEGGSSVAVFQLAAGTRVVREGDEITNGVRLAQVRRNRIDVERGGIHQEIRIGSSVGIQQVGPDSVSGSSTRLSVNPAQEFARQKARLRQEWLARNRG